MTDEIVFLVAIGASVLPSIVAFTRRHHHALAILVLNLLSGVPFGYFMLIGSELESAKMQMLLVAFLMWSAAMVWACTHPKGYFAREHVEQHAGSAAASGSDLPKKESAQ